MKLADDKTKLWVCDIGNPLEAGQAMNIEFVFDPQAIDAKQQNILFEFNVTSYVYVLEHIQHTYWNFRSNPESDDTVNDNYRSLPIEVEVSVQLKLNGASKPDQVNYGKADYRNTHAEPMFDDQIGPLVTHVYEVI